MIIPFAIDTETTGIDPAADSLLEIACCDADRDTIADSCVRFDGEIPPSARAVHHIAPEEVRDAPDRAIVIQDIENGLYQHAKEHRILVAHNAKFDRAFLPELEGETWICTERMAKHLYPDAESYGLQFLRYWLEIAIPIPLIGAPHRARYDAECCLALYERLYADAIAANHRVGTASTLLEWVSQPILLHRLPLGKHKGEAFEDVYRTDRGYLHWMMKQEIQEPGTWDEDLTNTVAHWLQS